jgi:hypothetical protein
MKLRSVLFGQKHDHLLIRAIHLLAFLFPKLGLLFVSATVLLINTIFVPVLLLPTLSRLLINSILPWPTRPLPVLINRAWTFASDHAILLRALISRGQDWIDPIQICPDETQLSSIIISTWHLSGPTPSLGRERTIRFGHGISKIALFVCKLDCQLGTYDLGHWHVLS